LDLTYYCYLTRNRYRDLSSDQNFVRLFANRNSFDVALGETLPKGLPDFIAIFGKVNGAAFDRSYSKVFAGHLTLAPENWV